MNGPDCANCGARLAGPWWAEQGMMLHTERYPHLVCK